MKENRINMFTATIALGAAVLMALALSFAIGKWSFGHHGYQLVIKFPNATGITVNSEVKYAGASIGSVKAVQLIPRDQQTQDPLTKQFNCVDVVVEIDNSIEIGNDVAATIKQDGFGISAKYVLLTPGLNHDSPKLVDGDVIQGEPPFDLSDLIQPAGEALDQAKALVAQLQPILGRLDRLSDKLDNDLPQLLDNGNKFLVDGDAVMSNFSTPAGRQRLNDMLDSLRVSSENLKVVSSNAKALTATLAQKPWRVIWGGATVQAPPEDEVLNSNKVIKLKPEVDASESSSSPSSSSSTTNGSGH
jgi:ABC-type transporter Mla subunit MlaD